MLDLAESSWHQQIQKYGKLNGKNIVVSGYPKLDIYNQAANLGQDIMCGVGKVDKKVIWALLVLRESNYSTFHNNYKFFQEIAVMYPNIFGYLSPISG